MMKVLAALSLLMGPLALQANVTDLLEFDHLVKHSSRSSHSSHSGHSSKHKHCHCPSGAQGPVGPIGPTGAAGPAAPLNDIFVWLDVNQLISSVDFPALLDFDQSVQGPGSGLSLSNFIPGTISLPPSGGTFLISVNLIGTFMDDSDIAEFQLLLNGSPIGLPMISSVGPQDSFVLSYQSLIIVPVAVENDLQVQLTTTAFGSSVELSSRIFLPPVVSGGLAGITVVQID